MSGFENGKRVPRFVSDTIRIGDAANIFVAELRNASLQGDGLGDITMAGKKRARLFRRGRIFLTRR
jgi:hypothetical protein